MRRRQAACGIYQLVAVNWDGGWGVCVCHGDTDFFAVTLCHIKLRGYFLYLTYDRHGLIF